MNASLSCLDSGEKVKAPSLIKFTIKFIIGILVGVVGFALVIMFQFKLPFLAKLYNSSWAGGWAFLFIVVWLLGFYLVWKAGWIENHRETGGSNRMDGKLTKEQRKILQKWLEDAKAQKRTLEKWLTAEDNKLKQLEDSIGKPIVPIRVVMDQYRQTLPKLDEEIKNLEDQLKQ